MIRAAMVLRSQAMPREAGSARSVVRIRKLAPLQGVAVEQVAWTGSWQLATAGIEDGRPLRRRPDLVLDRRPGGLREGRGAVRHTARCPHALPPRGPGNGATHIPLARPKHSTTSTTATQDCDLLPYATLCAPLPCATLYSYLIGINSL